MCPPKTFQAAPTAGSTAGMFYTYICIYSPLSRHFAKHTRAGALGLVLRSAGPPRGAGGHRAEGPGRRVPAPGGAAPGAAGAAPVPTAASAGPARPLPAGRAAATPALHLHRRPPKTATNQPRAENQKNSHSFCFFPSVKSKSVNMFRHAGCTRTPLSSPSNGSQGSSDPSSVPCPVDKRKDSFTQTKQKPWHRHGVDALPTGISRTGYP